GFLQALDQLSKLPLDLTLRRHDAPSSSRIAGCWRRGDGRRRGLYPPVGGGPGVSLLRCSRARAPSYAPGRWHTPSLSAKASPWRDVRRRLDVEMVRRGIAASRSEATDAIRSGKVTVDGRPAAKSSMLVLPEEPIAMARSAGRFVSRGGEKLDAALDRFGVHVSGRTALDAGASTGGFTDCLVSREAAHVIAIDVGYGQLDWRLREDARVTVLERTNVRDLQPQVLPDVPDLV